MINVYVDLGINETRCPADIELGFGSLIGAPAERVPEYFSNFGETFGHSLCPVAWYFAQVEPDGEVTFCGDFPDYFIGNVRKQPFREIWTGEKAQRFRAKLAKEPLPICARCCGSFVYGKWERPGSGY